MNERIGLITLSENQCSNDDVKEETTNANGHIVFVNQINWTANVTELTGDWPIWMNSIKLILGNK